MPHLLNIWPSILARLRQPDKVLLLFDYDGTLTPIVPRPEDALLSEEVRRLVGLLVEQPRYIVGIVSGRSLEDLVAMADIPGLIYAGNHGMEIRGAGMDFIHPGAEVARGELDIAQRKLAQVLAGIPGAFVEHKGLTLTVHYRAVAEALTARVESAVAEATAAQVHAGELRLTRGKKVIEVRPAIPWDKGRAIERIRDECGDLPLPVYFGDDRTDEDGFKVVQEMGGIAVFVGEARQGTVALHQLESPKEVAETLRLLLETS
jgi:trehalose-phosphatase